MKVEFIRKHRGKEIGTIEDVSDRVGHRFINRGMAKIVIEKIIKKRTRKKSNVKKLQSVSKRNIWK